jgi:FkbM family methyltransferase
MNWTLLFNGIKPKSFIDIGAHVGNFTTHVLKNSPDCECVMFEANPYCKPYLEKINKPFVIGALSSSEKTIPLYLEKINNIGTGASLMKENTSFYDEGKYSTLEVTTKRLDSFGLFPDQMVDLVKIDTQGSELDILIGGEKTIKRTKYVLLEVSTMQYNQGAPLMDQIINKMREYHFKIDDILEFHKSNNQIFQMDILMKNIYI